MSSFQFGVRASAMVAPILLTGCIFYQTEALPCSTLGTDQTNCSPPLDGGGKDEALVEIARLAQSLHINEVLAGDRQFIEIFNRSTDAVPLDGVAVATSLSTETAFNRSSICRLNGAEPLPPGGYFLAQTSVWGTDCIYGERCKTNCAFDIRPGGGTYLVYENSSDWSVIIDKRYPKDIALAADSWQAFPNGSHSYSWGTVSAGQSNDQR